MDSSMPHRARGFRATPHFSPPQKIDVGWLPASKFNRPRGILQASLLETHAPKSKS